MGKLFQRLVWQLDSDDLRQDLPQPESRTEGVDFGDPVADGLQVQLPWHRQVHVSVEVNGVVVLNQEYEKVVFATKYADHSATKGF